VLTSRWRIVDGLAVHARAAEHVPSWFPAVVLVHGLGMSSRYMLPLARELAPFYRVFAVDLPRFGRSGTAWPPPGLVEHAQFVADWMRAAGLPAATIVGHSYGAQVALELAVRRPRRVQRLVLVGPTTDPRARSRTRQIIELLVDATREPLSLLGIALTDYLRGGTRRLLHGLGEAVADRPEDRLARVSAPALVVRGLRDPLVGAPWAARLAAELPAGRLVVVPGVAHAAHYAAPRSVARVIRRFVDEVAPAATAVA
jgi:pimeloyl-ACP methyl ester carboxylesterase